MGQSEKVVLYSMPICKQKICEKRKNLNVEEAHSLSLLLPLLLPLLLALDDEDELPLPLLLLFSQQRKNYITT
jgi:hypothetical protein